MTLIVSRQYFRAVANTYFSLAVFVWALTAAC